MSNDRLILSNDTCTKCASELDEDGHCTMCSAALNCDRHYDEMLDWGDSLYDERRASGADR